MRKRWVVLGVLALAAGTLFVLNPTPQPLPLTRRGS